jgi:glycosyltransferase involved in cell wall biosynthesis
MVHDSYGGAVKVALLGTRGVPAQYGGFETAVEEIGRRLAERGYQVTVYCRNPGQSQTEYLGMQLVNAPAVRHRMAETLSHTTVSVAHAITRRRPDAVLLLNAGNAPLLPALRAARIPTAIHLDGLESRRAKWRGMGARYYQWAEASAIRNGQIVIADAQAIADHVEQKFGRTCVVIPYGAELIEPPAARLAELNLQPGDYHLVVARFEPENHVLEAVVGYRSSGQQRPLVVVGSAPYSQWYIDAVEQAAAGDERIHLVGAVYDQELLDQLYAHATTYIHGHSVGGTNPSLLRAMGAGTAVLALDVEFNREVTDGQALFWATSEDLTAHFNRLDEASMIEQLISLRQASRDRVRTAYQWETVTDDYESVIQRLVERRFQQ